MEKYENESDKLTDFKKYLLKFQNEDVVISYVKDCFKNVHDWPQTFEEIRARLLKIFHVLKIGKDCPQSAAR